MKWNRTIKLIMILTFILLTSCNNDAVLNDVKSSDVNKTNDDHDIEDININKNIENGVIDVRFKLGKSKEYNNIVVEDTEKLKSEGKEHSVKYYSYIPLEKKDGQDFIYYDVGNNERYMKINENILKNTYRWEDTEGVFTKKSPLGHKMSYGIDISKHNGNIDFKKVRDAGFEFVFIRIAYRGYGQKGTLKVDEMQEVNLKKAKDAGLKVGAYVFSQAINESEAIEEAKLAINILGNNKLDLPLVFDPETIKGDISRTDDVTGEQFTKNAIVFCDEVKKAGFTPAIYSNMVWEDYYYDLEKLKDYEIWYSDYNKIPQTPYNFKYWQFSEVGIVDGIDGEVDLNIMLY